MNRRQTAPVAAMLTVLCASSLHSQTLSQSQPAPATIPAALSIWSEWAKDETGVGNASAEHASAVTWTDRFGHFISFDVPGANALGPTPNGINVEGTIAGAYQDPSGLSHGFLRTRDGTLTTFDVPGATGVGFLSGTFPTAISSAGVVTGVYENASGIFEGFIRNCDGRITTYDAPPGFGVSGPIGTADTPPAINSAGFIAGTFTEILNGATLYIGYLRHPDGKIDTIEIPGAAESTEVIGIDDWGAVIVIANSSEHLDAGFIRKLDGTLVAIAGPCTTLSPPTAISAGGIVTGNCLGPSISGLYVRSRDGKFAIFNGPKSNYSSSIPFAVNDWGAVVGLDFASGTGFVRTPGNKVFSLYAPNGWEATPQSINLWGAITGYYCDSTVTACHGFLIEPYFPFLPR